MTDTEKRTRARRPSPTQMRAAAAALLSHPADSELAAEAQAAVSDWLRHEAMKGGAS